MISGKLTDDTKRAMLAVSQWKLGYREWAEIFIQIVESNDPITLANTQLSHGETVDSLVPPAPNWTEETNKHNLERIRQGDRRNVG